ncbi:hypothetical protein BD413DRAFT_307504 [Trametes elegans]|nr:hypothetical protein BD413DRAFT_307504 [Trametes elegans]
MKLLSPPPHSYAVIQMDPVGMVQHLEDPVATAAAAAMRPKKYLVYLELGLDLPSPTDPWFRYLIDPIGTTLRPPDPEEGITPEMVIPIHPNPDRPRGRPAVVHTRTLFPFSNCYHWIRNDFKVRVRRISSLYDDQKAVKLDMIQHMQIDAGFREDFHHIAAVREEKFGITTPAAARFKDTNPRRTPDSSRLSCRSSQDFPVVDADADTLPDGPDDDGTGSLSGPPHNTALHRTQQWDNSFVHVAMMIMSSWNVDDTVDFIPLVDLWFELADHLTPETIPSPVELFKERDAIMRIIHDARERAPSIYSPRLDDYDDDNLSSRPTTRTSHSSRTEEAHPPSTRPRTGMWRRVQRKARRLLVATTHRRVHPPCLPYWP